MTILVPRFSQHALSPRRPNSGSNLGKWISLAIVRKNWPQRLPHSFEGLRKNFRMPYKARPAILWGMACESGFVKT